MDGYSDKAAGVLSARPPGAVMLAQNLQETLDAQKAIRVRASEKKRSQKQRIEQRPILTIRWGLHLPQVSTA